LRHSIRFAISTNLVWWREIAIATARMLVEKIYCDDVNSLLAKVYFNKKNVGGAKQLSQHINKTGTHGD
jgi:hypothetical protein